MAARQFGEHQADEHSGRLRAVDASMSDLRRQPGHTSSERHPLLPSPLRISAMCLGRAKRGSPIYSASVRSTRAAWLRLAASAASSSDEHRVGTVCQDSHDVDGPRFAKVAPTQEFEVGMRTVAARIGLESVQERTGKLAAFDAKRHFTSRRDGNSSADLCQADQCRFAICLGIQGVYGVRGPTSWKYDFRDVAAADSSQPSPRQAALRHRFRVARLRCGAFDCIWASTVVLAGETTRPRSCRVERRVGI